MTSWTRATTVASTLSDRYALEQWAQRNIIFGLGQRPDLYALASAATLEDKDELNNIAKQAADAANSRSSANLGTALHRLTERIDSGEAIDVPEQWKPDIDAYCQTLADNRIEVHPEYIERVVLHPSLGIAGTTDRIVTASGRKVIADLKTGKHAVDFGAGEISMQLSIYAHSPWMWKAHSDDIQRDRYGRYLLPDPVAEPDAYDPMVDVDKDIALVIHLPVGTGTCSIHEVDLVAGYEAVGHAIWVREWRKRKDLSAPHVPDFMAAAEATLASQGLLDEVTEEQALTDITALIDSPTPTKGGLTLIKGGGDEPTSDPLANW